MADEFDPYLKWLAIPKSEQPPNHYRLLALPLFMDDADVIENAADQRMAHLRTLGSGKHSEFAQRILNEISVAKICLLSPEKKSAYDMTLRAEVGAFGQIDDPNELLATPAAVAVENQSAFIEPVKALPSYAKSTSPMRSQPLWRQPIVVVAALASVMLLVVVIVVAGNATRTPTDLAANGSPPARTNATSPPPPVKAAVNEPAGNQAAKTPAAKQAAQNQTVPTITSVRGGGVGSSGTKKGVPQPAAPTPNAPVSPSPSPSQAAPKETAPVPAAPKSSPPTPSAPRTTAPKSPAAPAPAAPAPAAPAPAATPGGEGKFALELPGSTLLVLEGTANLTALDREFTVEAWVRWPEDQVNGMSLLGNRARKHNDPDTRRGEWNLWYMAPTKKPEGKISLQYFLTEKKSHMMGARPTIDSARVWHHVVFSRAADRYWICLNGEVLLEEELRVQPSPHRAAHGDFYIGAHGGFWRSTGRGMQISAVRLSKGARYRQPFTPPREFEVDETSLAVLDFTRRLDGRVEDLTPNRHNGVFKKGDWIEFKD